MAKNKWPTRPSSVVSLHLDTKNPRLGRETRARAPREIVQYLFDHDKALEVAESIAVRGYFPNEPLLAVREAGELVVVEGNRRLAALKALKEPGILEGSMQRKVERLARKVKDPDGIVSVPVTLAPDRRSTDRQIAGRHVGTPVLAWQAENRASFILDKLEEGYDNDELRDELGFSLKDIQAARQTRAIADMARSLTLEDEVKAKLENPRAKIFTTVERVVESTVGRRYLHVEPDADHGIRINTSKNEFLKGFSKLVSDIALGKQSSRSLNSGQDIESYFRSWSKDQLPQKKRGRYAPADFVSGKSTASQPSSETGKPPTKKSKQLSKTVLPRDFKVRHGSERLVEIRNELTKLKREEFPNAGAVLLRVFLELSIVDFLERRGELEPLIAELKQKGKLQRGMPSMRDMVPRIIRVAKSELPKGKATSVEKAVKYDSAAPFTLSDLHSFVHQASEFPGDRDIKTFWMRAEPLFRLMLEDDSGSDPQ